MKKEMKYAGIAILAMVGIIAAQIGLTYLFTFRAGEIFSRTAMSALALYAVMRMCRKRPTKKAVYYFGN